MAPSIVALVRAVFLSLAVLGSILFWNEANGRASHKSRHLAVLKAHVKNLLRGNVYTQDARVEDTCDAPTHTLVLAVRERHLYWPFTGETKGPHMVRTVCEERGCDMVDGQMLPPTLHFKPGQVVTLLFKNEITGDPTGPNPSQGIDFEPNTNASEWKKIWPCENMTQHFTGQAPKNPQDVHVVQPLAEVDFDTADLHFHGMQITPHLFDPTSTLDPNAPLVRVKRGESYCYKFVVPEDHPSGSYFFHAHVHGSTWYHSQQMTWGAVQVDGPDSEDLAKQGVRRSEWYTLSDFKECAWKGEKYESCLHTNTKEAGEMVNGVILPTFRLQANEALHLRVMRIGDMPLSWKLLDADNNTVDVWNIGSDGIFFERAVKRSQFVLNFGLREDVIIQLPKEGKYRIVSDLNTDYWCFFDCNCHMYPITHGLVEVSGEITGARVDIGEIRLKPMTGAPRLQDTQIVAKRQFGFGVEFDRSKAPSPLFPMNNRLYNETFNNFVVKAGTAEEWVIFNPDNMMHVLHVHVNSFEVKEVKSAHPVVSDKFESYLDMGRLPPNKYRDTLQIPPQGFVRIWIYFDPKHRGKAVVHCHYLGHEDNGMMMNFIIE